MRKAPYWNFWKVLLVGLLIKYPGKFFAPFRFTTYVTLGALAVFILNMLK